MSILSLRARMVLVAAILLVGTGVLSLLFFEQIANRISTQLSSDFSVRHVLWQKERIGGVISRELALAQKMVDSAPILRWLQDEEREHLAQEAGLELESFRRLFTSQSYFAVSTQSLRFYYADKPLQRPQAIKTLTPDNDGDSWFFSTLHHGEDVNININPDEELQSTRVWFNLKAHTDGEVVGIIGTGVELTEFIHSLIHTTEAGVQTMLLSRQGAIMAHENPALITYNLLALEQEEYTTIFDLIDPDNDMEALSGSLEALTQGLTETITLEVLKQGTPHILSASWLPEIEWFAISLVDSRHLYGSGEFMQLALIMGGALIAVVALLGLFFGRAVLSPLRRIALGATQIAAGEYGTRLSIKRQDEIGELAKAFDHMSQMVEDHTQTLETRVQNRTKSLQEANERLSESNQKIREGITYAGLIQSALLPNLEQMSRVFEESLVIYEPKDGVGGDLYLLIENEEGVLLGVGDCTGHGVAGAMMTMTVHATLTNLAQKWGISNPGRLLTGLGQQIYESLNKETKTRMDNGLEMGLVFIDRNHKELCYAGAKMPLYQIQKGQVVMLKADRQSLGYRRSNREHNFSEHRLPLNNQTTYLLTSDGLLDQNGGDRGLPFGARRLTQLLEHINNQPLTAQKQHLEAILREFQREYTRRDDITLVAFRGLSIKE